MDKQPTRAGGWGISRSAPSEPWAASVLQAKTLMCARGATRFSLPSPTKHNNGAKEAAHARARAGQIVIPLLLSPVLHVRQSVNCHLRTCGNRHAGTV